MEWGYEGAARESSGPTVCSSESASWLSRSAGALIARNVSGSGGKQESSGNSSALIDPLTDRLRRALELARQLADVWPARPTQ
jgi:hypothetical protein